MKNVLAVLRRAHQPPVSLSAYIDGAASDQERMAVAAHVLACARCARLLEEMRSARAALSTLPQLDAPRSFRLHPSDLATPARAPRPSFTSRAIPALGAVALVAFAALVAVDVRGGGGAGGSGQMLAAGSAADIAEQRSAVRSAPAPAMAPEKSSDQPTPAAGFQLAPASPDANGALAAPATAAGPVPSDAGARSSGAPTASPPAADAFDAVRPAATSQLTPEASEATPVPSGSRSRPWLRWAEVIAGLAAAGLGLVGLRSWFESRRRPF